MEAFRSQQRAVAQHLESFLLCSGPSPMPPFSVWPPHLTDYLGAHREKGSILYHFGLFFIVLLCFLLFPFD